MQYDHILIRYGELSLKGKNKKQFISQLKKNVKQKLREFPDIHIIRARDRMYIKLNGQDHEPIIEKCREVFGIQSVNLALRVENSLDKIKEGALFALNEAGNAKTFKITTKRPNKSFDVPSQEMNQVLGGHLLSNTEGITVDVRNPDVEIRVEIRNDATYIMAGKIPASGGLPVGTTGKTLLLLSGGIDSPVAGYLAMKRGVKVEAIHFHSPPYTSERAKQKVLDLAKSLTKYGHEIRVHIVPFTELQQKIFREIPEGYGMTVMRRQMLKVSERLAKQEGILSLTTGESLGQVASQTMESMNAINEVTNYPIIRPLVAMDKVDIIDISRKIGTYETSIQPYEDCCTIFVPKQPKTRPSREKIHQFEDPVDFSEDIDKILRNIETITFTEHEQQSDDFGDLL
ncbi:tRNA uracil 4-sulfurtransferase ThiI [Salinibacillus xinjiangensis]|uniref:Probable tRNA sulfurtransferase n=1 Tax=Salinibacillus xinjiangensis TaxID=1229268 RepID=A0A6G1X9M5_9BACI|nr:tRNA uracil 4-sulfurtransferase ThiI [Salinibacillus xinjiangensis]MRG87713.1 tRNA 4-thiouridine(8) synthase ThiI [Salinibacillus xinjiangensis]